jgi:predicted nucleic acid-binding protein
VKARVIDANVILRFLTRDQPEQAERCKALFTRLEAGEEMAYLPVEP